MGEGFVNFMGNLNTQPYLALGDFFVLSKTASLVADKKKASPHHDRRLQTSL